MVVKGEALSIFTIDNLPMDKTFQVNNFTHFTRVLTNLISMSLVTDLLINKFHNDPVLG